MLLQVGPATCFRSAQCNPITWKKKGHQMKATAVSSKTPVCGVPFGRCCLLFPLFLTCFAFSQMAQAVSPAPDGGYPNNNTAEGTSALFSLSSGVDNTALGFQALYHNTTSNFNTAERFRALFSNSGGTQNTA